MDEKSSSSEDDSGKVQALKKSSSSSDMENQNRPSGSGSTANFTHDKVKKRVKKRICHRRKNSDANNAEESSSYANELNKPGSSTATFHKLQKRVKRRSYRKTHSDGEDASAEAASPAASAEETPGPTAKTNGDNSSTESEANEEKDADDNNSDDWTTTEEETNVTPLVLRKIKPKSTLSIVNEVMNRQIGHSRQFDKKLYGSLHMVERLKYLHSLDEHKGCVNTVEFNKKGDLLVSGSDDLAIIVWNWATGRKLNSYESGHKNNIFQASWLPRDDLSMMVTCASDGQVRLLDLINGTTRKLATHDGACNKFAIHPDSPHIAISVGDDGKVLSIDVRDGEITKLVTMKGRAVLLYTIHSNPRNGNEFCVGGHSESVNIYDRRKASTPLFKLCPKNLIDNGRVHVTSATYNHDGTEILASYNDDDIYLFDTLIPHPHGDYAHKYEGHRNSRTIKGVNFFGPKSEFIVSGSDCGNIYFWEKNTEAIVQCMPGDAQVVNRVQPHPHIPVLATSGLDDDVKIWMPSSDQAPILSDLKEYVIANMSDRAEERAQCRGRDDGNLFWIILEHVCRNRESFSFFQSRSGGTLDDDTEDDDDLE